MVQDARGKARGISLPLYYKRKRLALSDYTADRMHREKWTWNAEVSRLSHNHKPSAGLDSHPAHRAMTAEQIKAETTAMQCGTTDAQAVIDHLQAQLIPYRVQVDEDNSLHSLFLTEPMSIALGPKIRLCGASGLNLLHQQVRPTIAPFRELYGHQHDIHIGNRFSWRKI